MKFSIRVRTNKDGSKTWFLQYRPYGYKGPQKTVQLPEVTSRRQAEAARARYEADSDAGILPSLSKETVADYLSRWVDGKRRLSWNSRLSYKRMAALAGEYFGRLKLVELQRQHVDTWVSAMEPVLQPGSIHAYFATFKRALGDAAADKLIRDNPAARVELPRLEEGRRDAYAPAEVRALLEAARAYPYPYGPMAATMVLAGLRIGEAQAVTVANVDLATRTMTVDQQIQREHGRRVEKAPKWNSSGVVAIPETLVPFLEVALREQAKAIEANKTKERVFRAKRYLFVTTRAYLTESRWVRHHVYEIQRLAGVRRMVLHESRHTAGTLVVDATGDQRDAKQLLRHKTMAATERYVHVRVTESARRAASALDSLLNEATG